MVLPEDYLPDPKKNTNDSFHHVRISLEIHCLVIRGMGVRVESLARIKAMSVEGGVEFC